MTKWHACHQGKVVRSCCECMVGAYWVYEVVVGACGIWVLQNGDNFWDIVLNRRCCWVDGNMTNRNWSVQPIRATLQAVWSNQSNLFDVFRSECYKTVVILETPFWVGGAAESMEMRQIVVGASNKSGRRCMPSDEINLICLMYLDLGVTKRW